MSNYVRYLIQFPTADSAAEAMVSSGGEPDKDPKYDGQDVRVFTQGSMMLRAHRSTAAPDVVAVSSYATYIPTTMLLDQDRWEDIPDLRYLEAVRILNELNFLRELPGLSKGVLLYGMGSMTLRATHEPVDTVFRAMLRKLVKSREGRPLALDEGWQMMNRTQDLRSLLIPKNDSWRSEVAGTWTHIH